MDNALPAPRYARLFAFIHRYRAVPLGIYGSVYFLWAFMLFMDDREGWTQTKVGPPLIGVMGFDGFLFDWIEAHGTYRPWFSPGYIVVALVCAAMVCLCPLLFARACCGPAAMPRAKRILTAISVGLPLACLAFAIMAVAFELRGEWNSDWLFDHTRKWSVFGNWVYRPRPQPLWALFGPTWFMASIVAYCIQAFTGRRGAVSLVVAMLWAAATATATVAFLTPTEANPRWSGWHNARIMTISAGIWFLGALVWMVAFATLQMPPIAQAQSKNRAFESNILKFFGQRRARNRITLALGLSIVTHTVIYHLINAAAPPFAEYHIFGYARLNHRTSLTGCLPPFVAPALTVLGMCGLYYVGLHAVRGRSQSLSLACSGCAYDLRGSVPAGRVACPECGRRIPDPQLAWIKGQAGQMLADLP